MTTIVSHRYRYIFVHIPKNGGSSIQSMLMNCEPAPLLRKLVWRAFMMIGSGKQTVSLSRVDNGRSLGWSFSALHGHAHAAELKEVLPGGVFDRYFKFAVVRNPWDRCVSRFEYYRQVNERRGRSSGLMTFPEFLDHDFQPQKKRISDADGNLLVDFIGRVESIEADMSHVFKACGLPLSASSLPQANRTERTGYHSYYNDQTRELVREKYRDDVTSFGYEF